MRKSETSVPPRLLVGYCWLEAEYLVYSDLLTKSLLHKASRLVTSLVRRMPAQSGSQGPEEAKGSMRCIAGISQQSPVRHRIIDCRVLRPEGRVGLPLRAKPATFGLRQPTPVASRGFFGLQRRSPGPGLGLSQEERRGGSPAAYHKPNWSSEVPTTPLCWTLLNWKGWVIQSWPSICSESQPSPGPPTGAFCAHTTCHGILKKQFERWNLRTHGSQQSAVRSSIPSGRSGSLSASVSA